ncbi:hypothetical protein HU200_012302 [Digitaria exilis]|uniref:F-box domain-containing protein n=1 Tax=Digitaria exilis TaxID=1010633 RepID=A0A835FF89_9POAL|nr:hypothetical protein HU200_012302 [Digitaria exilis]
MADDVVDGSRLPEPDGRRRARADPVAHPGDLTAAAPPRLQGVRWRNVIDERTSPEEKLPAKILVFINHGRSSSVIVFDNASCLRTHSWTYTSSSDGGSVHMVGTCNGLLCQHDHSTYGGFSFSAIRVTNPITGETVALPPVPERWSFTQFSKAPGKSEREAHAAAAPGKMPDVDGFNLPADAFVEILLRLPTTTRRLLRFVCKRWRDVIDERVPDRHVTPKTLAFFRKTGSAIVFSDSGDQQEDDGRGGQQEWSFSSSDRGVIHLVGTCNGLLCLRNDVSVRHGGRRRMCSTINVVNPITGQRIMAPYSSISWDYRWCLVSRKLHRFSFGYHPTTGKYKVVDVTCSTSSSLKRTGLLTTKFDSLYHCDSPRNSATAYKTHLSSISQTSIRITSHVINIVTRTSL